MLILSKLFKMLYINTFMKALILVLLLLVACTPPVTIDVLEGRIAQHTNLAFHIHPFLEIEVDGL